MYWISEQIFLRPLVEESMFDIALEAWTKKSTAASLVSWIPLPTLSLPSDVNEKERFIIFY